MDVRRKYEVLSIGWSTEKILDVSNITIVNHCALINTMYISDINVCMFKGLQKIARQT